MVQGTFYHVPEHVIFSQVSYESHGFDPDLPKLRPFPLKDVMGQCVAFSMLVHSWLPGKHTKLYTQFATIRTQRSAFSNVYSASMEAANDAAIISVGTQTTSRITTCPTNSLWFSRWSTGCETRMGFVLKQNTAIYINVMKALISSFRSDIANGEPGSWE